MAVLENNMWLIILLITSIICNIVYYLIRRRDKFYINGMSFKESLDLINLPIVTFEYEDKKLNLILDTGSDDSFIDPECIKDFNLPLKEVTTSIGTGNGTITSSGIVELNIKYKNTTYNNLFILSDLSGAFDRLKKERGIEVHGILGSIFFTRYKYKLDFKNKLAYT